MSARADGTLSIRAGRDAYFAANCLPADGGYNEKWVRFKVMGIPVVFPNTEARKRQVPAHDVHHVLTGYGTDLTGESEIGAWEIGSGCDGPARHLGLRVMSVAIFWALGRTFRAFLLGRQCKNFYAAGTIGDDLLARPVSEVRAEIGLDAALEAPTSADRLAFAGWCLAAFGVAWAPILVIAGIWWIWN